MWQPVIFHGDRTWMEKAVGGWSLSGIMTLHTGFGWTPVYTEPHQIYCNTCNYGYQSLRPTILEEPATAPATTPLRPEATSPVQALPTPARTIINSPNNYFSIPNYANAITDNPGQSTTNFIPAPGIDRNTFPGPGYRDVDLNIAKAFGLPKMKSRWEKTRRSKSRLTCSTSLTC